MPPSSPILSDRISELRSKRDTAGVKPKARQDTWAAFQKYTYEQSGTLIEPEPQILSVKAVPAPAPADPGQFTDVTTTHSAALGDIYRKNIGFELFEDVMPDYEDDTIAAAAAAAAAAVAI